MPRKLFCELGPWAYQLSLWKVCALRHLRNLRSRDKIAREHSAEPLPCLVYAHKSLIRRRLGEVDMRLQENKAVNLGLAAPHVDGILIRPGETFSFWALVGNCTARRGYLDGLTLSKGRAFAGVGGGLCQFTNLLHWMALHSPLEIAEHHHHDAYDLFPDFGRQGALRLRHVDPVQQPGLPALQRHGQHIPIPGVDGRNPSVRGIVRCKAVGFPMAH